MLRWAAVVLLGAIVAGCDEDEPPSARRLDPSPERTAAPRASATRVDEAPLLGQLAECDFEHRGVLLDIGSEATDSHRSFAVGPFEDVAVQEIGGATIGRMRTKRVQYDFWLREDIDEALVTVRATGELSRRASVYLDDRHLGRIRLERGEMTGHRISSPKGLSAGRHTVTLHFTGTIRQKDEAYAGVDWIRIGRDGDQNEHYAAPTLDRVVSDVVLDKEPKRSIVLRGPATVRCAIRVTGGSKMSVAVGYWGRGKGVSQIRAYRDGQAPVVLAERRVTGGPGAAWTPVTIDLQQFESELIGLELRAVETEGVGRVAFGEPKIVGPERPVVTSPTTRVAVVVVLSGLDRNEMPPWGPVHGLTAVSELTRDAVAFDSYRVPSTVVSAVFASLLTGLSPHSHTLEDPLARLPVEYRTLPEMTKEASGRSALFSGVPMTFAAFGFDRGWDEFESFSPVKDIAAHEPLVRATSWLKDRLTEDPDSRSLLVVHLRGGHPPWDLTQEQVSALPPKDYSGVVEARRGAIRLAEVRSRRRQSRRRLRSEDWTRLSALRVEALRKQDKALGELMEMLERAGAYRDALVVLMGDVSSGRPPHVPFAAAPRLRQDVLLTPLVVKFPGLQRAGQHVTELVTTMDVTKTVVDSLKLDGPDTLSGYDLLSIAAGVEPLNGRPHTATLGNSYSTLWGPWLLGGEVRLEPHLCQIEVDPACSDDVGGDHPMAEAALWRRTYVAETEAASPKLRLVDREPAAIDPETRAALKVFGY